MEKSMNIGRERSEIEADCRALIYNADTRIMDGLVDGVMYLIDNVEERLATNRMDFAYELMQEAARVLPKWQIQVDARQYFVRLATALIRSNGQLGLRSVICPDWSYVKGADGVVVYTFEQLNGGVPQTFDSLIIFLREVSRISDKHRVGVNFGAIIAGWDMEHAGDAVAGVSDALTKLESSRIAVEKELIGLTHRHFVYEGLAISRPDGFVDLVRKRAKQLVEKDRAKVKRVHAARLPIHRNNPNKYDLDMAAYETAEAEIAFAALEGTGADIVVVPTAPTLALETIGRTNKAYIQLDHGYLSQ